MLIEMTHLKYNVPENRVFLTTCTIKETNIIRESKTRKPYFSMVRADDHVRNKSAMNC